MCYFHHSPYMLLFMYKNYYYSELLLNLRCHHHIYLWGLTPRMHDYEMFISISGFRKLKPILKKTKTKVVILNRYGLPFFLHKYRKRKVFFIGAVGCMLSIYLFSMIVWNIHIEGNYSQTDEVILEFLETKKVYHGMPKAKINCERIAKDIRKQFDDIIWVSVSIQGSRLMIQVKENTDTVPQKVNKEEKVTDLVASENGEVVEIIARSGVPLVSVGDKVKKGDVLVSGRVEIKNDAKEVVEYRYQPADADIRLKVSHSYQFETPTPSRPLRPCRRFLVHPEEPRVARSCIRRAGVRVRSSNIRRRIQARAG